MSLTLDTTALVLWAKNTVPKGRDDFYRLSAEAHSSKSTTDVKICFRLMLICANIASHTKHICSCATNYICKPILTKNNVLCYNCGKSTPPRKEKLYYQIWTLWIFTSDIQVLNWLWSCCTITVVLITQLIYNLDLTSI